MVPPRRRKQGSRDGWTVSTETWEPSEWRKTGPWQNWLEEKCVCGSNPTTKWEQLEEEEEDQFLLESWIPYYSIRWATRLATRHSGSPTIIQAKPCPFLYISCWHSSGSFPLNFTHQYCLYQGSFRSYHTSKSSDHPLLNDLQQHAILPNVLCNSSVYLHVDEFTQKQFKFQITSII